ncbi:sortase [Candidatus Gottesmanbacteria bacterium]|nr:sortase [Candidatus Gottesmanbacteria bacterium]
MALYQYVKAPPAGSVAVWVRRGRPVALSFLLMSVGAAILIWAMWPIVSFAVLTAPFLSAVVSPVGSGGVLTPVVLAATGEGGADYTNPNIWFPTFPQKKIVAPVTVYSLSIPKLKINNAVVTVAGDDLNHSLVHYGGTGLPGEYGTTVIFGHSVLPQFFDPTNYKTIFSTLPTLKEGDDIFVTYDNITYRYQVFDMVVTEPNDLSSLEQTFDVSRLTLITCVPPGTYWKRLNVKAKLIKPPTG